MSGTVELKKYEYRPLREGPNNIRLVQILPGTGDATIVCHVFQYTLRNEKAFGLYEALSYVWGDFNNPHDILIRNSEDSEYRDFRVTHNLYGALRRLRDPDLPRTFWIDAICINQDDLQERAIQVMIMARIYAYATSVSVWLGEADNDSSATFDLLQDILGQRSRRAPGWVESIKFMVTPAAASIQALLERDWFERSWVVQEAVVARVTSITCGDAEMPGAMFAQCIDLALCWLRTITKKPWDRPAVLVLMDSRTQRSLPLLQRISTLQMSAEIPSFKIAPLGDLLNMFENHKATDKRDKIYALLGLSSDNALTPDLRPDYTTSWSALFGRVASHILGSTATISVAEGKSQAVVSDFGCALGTVVDCQGIRIIVESPSFGCGRHHASYLWEATWNVPHGRGRCKSGDILVFLQEARHPCIVRPCGEHFDIVLVSLPEPKYVKLIELPLVGPEVVLDDPYDAWVYLIRRARKTFRKFTLVWDWATESQDDYAGHAARIEMVQDCHPNIIERCFNTARVLDDMADYDSLLQVLQVWPRSTCSTEEEKHLVLLEQACALWDDFCELKGYIQDLYLCIWSLNAPMNFSHITDYWFDRGFLGPDLFDIAHLAKAGPETAVVSEVRYEPHVPILEPFRNRLLPILFPRYLPFKFRKAGLLSTERAVSLHSGRFLMGLVLASETALVQPSAATLDKLRKDRITAPRLFIIHGILTEYKSTQLDPVGAMERIFGSTEGVVELDELRQCFREFSVDAAWIYQLLQHLYWYTEGWPLESISKIKHQVLWPCVDIFVRHLQALCHLELDLSANAQKPFYSVLYILYVTYRPNGAVRCYDVSKYARSWPFSLERRAEWAQKAILQRISELRQELQLDDLSSSDDEAFQ